MYRIFFWKCSSLWGKRKHTNPSMSNSHHLLRASRVQHLWFPLSNWDLQQLLPTRVLGLLNQQKLIRGQQRNPGKALLGPVLQQGDWEQTTRSLVCSFPEGRGRQACSLYGVRGGVCPGLRPEGCLRWFAHPLGVQGACSVPCFCSKLFKSFHWDFGLCIFCPGFALYCACMQLFLVP